MAEMATLHPSAKSTRALVDIEPDSDCVDGDLVRGLVASGAADAIIGEHERRRQQHREEMVRYRRRKKSTRERLQREEQQLSKQLKTALRLRASASALNKQTTSENVAPTADTLVRVLQAKEQLHLENVALRRQWDDAQHFESVLRFESARNEESRTHTSPETLAPLDRGSWVTLLAGEAPFYFVPFEVHECRALVDSSVHRVVALQTAAFDADTGALAGTRDDVDRSVHKLREPVVVRFFQWRAHLAHEWDNTLARQMIRYKFCKQFRLPVRSLAQVGDRIWELLHSPALFQSIYRVPVHLRILQRWRHDLSVALWSTPSPDRSVRGRTTTLFSRTTYTNVQGDECVRITLTGVRLKKPPADSVGSGCGVEAGVTLAGERVELTDQGTIYFLLTRSKVDTADGAIEMEHGGCVEVVSEAMAQYLMVELGGTLVRIEHLVLPMRVLRSE